MLHHTTKQHFNFCEIEKKQNYFSTINGLSCLKIHLQPMVGKMTIHDP